MVAHSTGQTANQAAHILTIIAGGVVISAGVLVIIAGSLALSACNTH